MHLITKAESSLRTSSFRGTPRESHLTVSKNAVCVDGDKNDVNEIIDLRRRAAGGYCGIVSTEQYAVPPRLVTLYLAKKNGAWLKHDYSVEELLQGKIDTGYKKMLSSWILDEDYLGAEFEPGRKEIHVLVELPVPDSHCVDIGEPDPRLLKYQRKYSL
ncbi:unnamed protein product [Phytophthora lilii]|uniref:Unnamed protein product n=1 Tax=Phytophthora lilii TaxID=2077276 RepID=A0A9W7D212_9STRA|nr:unnamed protein product [Phytophthora lilii]